MKFKTTATFITEKAETSVALIVYKDIVFAVRHYTDTVSYCPLLYMNQVPQKFFLLTKITLQCKVVPLLVLKITELNNI